MSQAIEVSPWQWRKTDTKKTQKKMSKCGTILRFMRWTTSSRAKKTQWICLNTAAAPEHPHVSQTRSLHNERVSACDSDEAEVTRGKRAHISLWAELFQSLQHTIDIQCFLHNYSVKKQTDSTTKTLRRCRTRLKNEYTSF